jgi:hypothetical protein
MTSVDNNTFLSSGGYLQKGVEVNVREIDLGSKVADLLPSRYVNVKYPSSRWILTLYLDGTETRKFFN